MVVARHHMEVEHIAVATEVATMEIHLDLVANLPGGKCHNRTLSDFSPSNSETVLARRSPGTWPWCSITAR